MFLRRAIVRPVFAWCEFWREIAGQSEEAWLRVPRNKRRLEWMGRTLGAKHGN